ncbi:hypothetical protein [Caulobacter sp. NIBR2454]|uniref:hypothetical protein n=1 Tax=Caulobacter sp. NIBR2454 TaxID=3015996 RepID=UPI0022B606E9|nr:hypothetical protein [Caulobacter sp. NIBR2454]
MARKRLPAAVSFWRLIFRLNLLVGSLTAVASMVLLTALQPEAPEAFIGFGLAACGVIHAWISASALHRLHWRWVVECED